MFMLRSTCLCVICHVPMLRSMCSCAPYHACVLRSMLVAMPCATFFVPRYLSFLLFGPFNRV